MPNRLRPIGWLLTALAVGIVVAWVRSYLHGTFDVPVISQIEFEKGLYADEGTDGSLIDLTVLPPTESKTVVLATRLSYSETGGFTAAMPVAFVADIPYQPDRWRGGAETYHDIMDYMMRYAPATPSKQFRYAWWRETWANYVFAILLSTLLLGAGAPSVLGLLRQLKQMEPVKSDSSPNASPTGVEEFTMDGIDTAETWDAQPETRDASPPTTTEVRCFHPQSPIAIESAPLPIKKYQGEFYPVERKTDV